VLFEDIVSAVVGQGGFDTSAADVSTSTVQGWVNEVYKEVVAESQWLMALQTLATTVAGQNAYDLPETVADVRSLTIADSDGPGDWQPKSLEDIWGLQRGRLGLVGSGGVFALSATSSGTKQIVLFPAPTVSGTAIQALVALIPGDMVNGNTPAIPADMHGRLIDGAIALGLLRLENRPDLAQGLEQRKDAMKAMLGRRKNSRLGSTPTRIAVEKYDF
jgi:hypothetical protein